MKHNTWLKGTKQKFKKSASDLSEASAARLFCNEYIRITLKTRRVFQLFYGFIKFSENMRHKYEHGKLPYTKRL